MYANDLERLTLTAHPRPWRVYNKPLRAHLSKAKIIEIQDANGRAVIPWPGFDDTGRASYAGRLRLAKFIVQAVNESGSF